MGDQIPKFMLNSGDDDNSPELNGPFDDALIADEYPYIPRVDDDDGQVHVDNVREMLETIVGCELPDDTPSRFANALAEMTQNVRSDRDPDDILATTFPVDGLARETVAMYGVAFRSVCEHHLLPFRGHVNVAYDPAEDRVFGLSKLARLVNHYAFRPQVQERLTRQIREALSAQPLVCGAAVEVVAEHECVAARGVQANNSVTRTKSTAGSLDGYEFDDPTE